jgi:hypothetical protein
MHWDERDLQSQGAYERETKALFSLTERQGFFVREVMIVEKSRDGFSKTGIEALLGQLNCPKAVRCYQFRDEKFAEPEPMDGGGWQLGCLESNPLQCPMAEFSAAADSYVCTCAVRTYVVGKAERGSP